MNGPGFSPDGGNYWEKDGVLYWEDGDITVLGPNVWLRTMDVSTGIDYSAWSDEERAAVKEKWRLKRIAAKDQYDAGWAECQRLVESAKAKVTEEEWDALIRYLRDGF